MGYDRWVAVQVGDEAGYAAYREGMMPILERFGGCFVVDVRVEEVLRAPENASFNRLFLIRFQNQESMEAFFSDETYMAVRHEHFVPSVERVVSLGAYPS